MTNDFRTALFFATCKYDVAADSFYPLTNADINQSEDSKYGYIFHSPDWVIDYINGSGFNRWFVKHGFHKKSFLNDNLNENLYLQSGNMDGIAFQIGYQPLYRCHYQSGYIFPMRNETSLQQNEKFEKIRFKQSEQLSQKVYDAMNKGKAVFPNEGILEIKSIVEDIKNSLDFSMSDLQLSYENDGVDKTLFSTVDELKNSLQGFSLSEGKIKIHENDIVQTIPKYLLDKVNAHYDGKDLYEMVGRMIHVKPEDQKYREARCIEIYGKLI